MKARRLVLLGLLGAGAGYLLLKKPRTTYSFAGKSVVITGGSRGLGLIMARQLAAEGAKLTLLARDELTLERAELELKDRGAQVLTISCDVSKRVQVEEAMQQVIDHYGHIDVLINNAGIIQTGPVEHMQLRDFELTMGVHLWGSLYTMLAAIPHMKARDGGRIVNISSLGGRLGFPHLTPYNTSKFALVGLSDSMRAELAKDGILITTVTPGLMRTGSHHHAFIKGQHEKEFAWFALLDSLPLISTDADASARRILAACRRGAAELTFPVHIRVLTLMDRLFPRLSAFFTALAGRLLPKPTGEEGDRRKKGLESHSSLAPSFLTALADRAARENNEL